LRGLSQGADQEDRTGFTVRRYKRDKTGTTTMAPELSVDVLFDAAVRIQLLERSIIVSFGADRGLRIKFPITRRLAEFLGMPHYLVLRHFAVMENMDLVTKAERDGIVTTKKGSRKMIALMRERYRKETESILGVDILEELYNKTR
jgi:hypothetical protein